MLRKVLSFSACVALMLSFSQLSLAATQQSSAPAAPASNSSIQQSQTVTQKEAASKTQNGANVRNVQYAVARSIASSCETFKKLPKYVTPDDQKAFETMVTNCNLGTNFVKTCNLPRSFLTYFVPQNRAFVNACGRSMQDVVMRAVKIDQKA